MCPQISESPSEIMESLTAMYNIPKDKQILLFTHIRLAHGFSNHKRRLQAVQARLHAISILGELTSLVLTKISTGIYFHEIALGSRFLSGEVDVMCVFFFNIFIFFAVYSNALQDSANSILYNGLIEELVDVLQITDKQLVVGSNYSSLFLTLYGRTARLWQKS